jgi:ATP-binding cassette subfamily B protein
MGMGDHKMRFRVSDAARAATALDSRQALRRLFAYLRLYKAQLGLVFILIIISTILLVIGPLLMGIAIDQYIEGQDVAGLARISLAMVVVYLGSWLTWLLYGRIMAAIAQKAMYTLRRDLFAHMQTLSLSYFDRQPAGDLMSRLTNDMDAISDLLSQNITQADAGGRHRSALPIRFSQTAGEPGRIERLDGRDLERSTGCYRLWTTGKSRIRLFRCK